MSIHLPTSRPVDTPSPATGADAVVDKGPGSRRRGTSDASVGDSERQQDRSTSAFRAGTSKLAHAVFSPESETGSGLTGLVTRPAHDLIDKGVAAGTRKLLGEDPEAAGTGKKAAAGALGWAGEAGKLAADVFAEVGTGMVQAKVLGAATGLVTGALKKG